MTPTIEVVLIDGVGRPRVVPIVAEDLPAYIGYAHEGIKSGPNRIVRFDHCPGVEMDGRPVYRLVWTRAENGEVSAVLPLVRYEYLAKTPIVPFNQPRLES